MNPETPEAASLVSTARPKSPYPGLRPFAKDEWSIFFGRERMIDEVIERLAVHRLVLIHGASGAGKSSLVRAGVLPRLAGQYLRIGTDWQTFSIRPSGGPLWNLAKEFARLEGRTEDVTRIDEIVGAFSRPGATLSSIVGALGNVGARRLCILVDQFEELFRFEKETSREEAELFVDLLVRNDSGEGESLGGAGEEAHAQQKDTRPATVHVVVTMRSEFLGDCARFSGLAETINRTQYLVPRMDREALMRAIRRPAQLYGGEVTLDLAERLIADAGGREDELPLIQHGLMLMWHDAAAKPHAGSKIMLDAAPLEAAGGLSRMLSKHADEAANTAAPDPERRIIVERLFRALTDVNVEGKAIRRPQSFRDLVAVTATDPDTLRGIIEALRRDGVSFLTPYPPAPIVDATPIDIGHEALIRCWGRLSDPQTGWLKREFDDGLVWRSLLVEARSFESDKRRILSPATAEERSEWLQSGGLNAPWAERYGGDFGLVEQLLAASQKAASAAAAEEARRQAGRRKLAAWVSAGVTAVVALTGFALKTYFDAAHMGTMNQQLQQALGQEEAAMRAAQAAEAQARQAEAQARQAEALAKQALAEEKAAENNAAAARSAAAARQAAAAQDLGLPPANRAYADESTVFRQPNGQPVVAPTDPVTNVNSPTANTIPGATVLTTYQLYNAIANQTLGTQILVDARSAPHPTTIPGASSFPAAGAGTLDQNASDALWDQLGTLTGKKFDVAIVFFARDVNDWEGYNAALRAINFGYARVYWYRGGIAAWQAAGQPLKPPGQPTNQPSGSQPNRH